MQDVYVERCRDSVYELAEGLLQSARGVVSPVRAWKAVNHSVFGRGHCHSAWKRQGEVFLKKCDSFQAEQKGYSKCKLEKNIIQDILTGGGL